MDYCVKKTCYILCPLMRPYFFSIESETLICAQWMVSWLAYISNQQSTITYSNSNYLYYLPPVSFFDFRISVNFISSELISVQCSIKPSLRMNDKSQHYSLVFFFRLFFVSFSLVKTRRMCVFMWVEKTMRKHNQLLLIVEGDNSNASTARMCATTQTQLLWS